MTTGGGTILIQTPNGLCAMHIGWIVPRTQPMPGSDSDEGDPIHRLSPRQVEILRLRAQGLQDSEIAERIGISIGRVRNSLSEAYRRLGIRCPYPGPAACYLLGRHDERAGR